MKKAILCDRCSGFVTKDAKRITQGMRVERIYTRKDLWSSFWGTDDVIELFLCNECVFLFEKFMGKSV